MFVGIPFLDVLRRSFCTPLTNDFTGLSQYLEVLNSAAFRLAAVNTLRFMAVCIPLLLVLSFLLGILVEKGDIRHGLFKTTLVLPMAIPVASIVLLWKIVFCPDGLWNQLLSVFTGQFREKDWVNGPTAFGVLAATFLWKNAGYCMLLWLSGLSAVPASLYEAAKVDGAGTLKRIIYITLPELKGTFFLTLILSSVNSFRIYREAYLIAGKYPDESIYMMQHLFNNWFLNLEIQKVCTAAVLLTLMAMIPVILFLLVRRRL